MAPAELGKKTGVQLRAKSGARWFLKAASLRVEAKRKREGGPDAADTCGRDRRTARQGPGDGAWADNTQRGARAPKQAWDACSLGRRGWCGESPDAEAAGTPRGGRARVGAARWSAVRGVTGWFKTALHMFDR
jgi:hypothetical protein